MGTTDNFGCFQVRSREPHLPPGFRFHPTDEELVAYYLLKKVLDCNFTCRAIAEADLNKCEPWHLPGKAMMGEKEWYFYSLRDRKYPTGLRTNRATGAGYWKATGKDREIYSSKAGLLVGMKKTLVFYTGRAPKGQKSLWVMHEFRLDGKLAYNQLSPNAEDEWVICRVFQKTGSGSSTATYGGGGGGGSNNKKPSVIIGPSKISSESMSTPSSGVYFDSCISTLASSKQHVPCFSTSASSPPNFSHGPLFESPAPPPLSSDLSAVVSGTSSFSFATQPPAGGGTEVSSFGYWPVDRWDGFEMNRHRLWPGADGQPDCTWTY